MTQISIETWTQETAALRDSDVRSPRRVRHGRLRSGEIALRGRRQRQSRPSEPGTTQQVDVRAKNASPARRYETPTFDPRCAFARTLRSGEIARLERRQRLTDQEPPAVLVCAA